MWPHPQQSSLLLSGLSFVYVSTQYHTPAAMMPFLIKLCATLLLFRTKTTDDAAIPPLFLLSLIVRGFASHLTWVMITIPSFSNSNSSRIFCTPSVPFPLYRMSRTGWILCLSQDPFSLTSTTPLSTILAAVMMIPRYCRAISAVPLCAWLQ